MDCTRFQKRAKFGFVLMRAENHARYSLKRRENELKFLVFENLIIFHFDFDLHHNFNFDF